MDAGARRTALVANTIAAFDLSRRHIADPRGATQTFGTVTAVRTGLEVAYFNPVIAADHESRFDDVAAAVDWVESAGLPSSLHVAEEAIETFGSRIDELGFPPGGPEPEPMMVLDPIPEAPPPPAHVRVRAGGADLFEPFHAAMDSGPTLRRLFPPSWSEDPNVRLAVADLDGDPVAVAVGVRTASTVGVYAVFTAERARRRGLGAAVTWAVIQAGVQAWGSEIAILTSSGMGFGVYRSMGFEVIGRMHVRQRPVVPD